MVFPKDEGNEMNTRVVMVVDSIFREIGKKWEEKKYCSLAPDHFGRYLSIIMFV